MYFFIYTKNGDLETDYFIPESNRRSSEWIIRDEPNLRRGKAQRSANKVMAFIIRDANEISFVDYHEK